ncbi:MAG TPA: hypothetical protein VKX28_12005 [Xanthobacteraceae bacterium]|jgi:hypothetical protein|nr:hypothetical protein [Xanthobacteraceae bacterium]
MTKRDPILAIAAVLMLGMAGASAGELPSYEFAGLPITPLQMSVLGQSGRVQERQAAPTLIDDGMPASPHQIAVLSHRRAAARFDAAQTRIGTVTRVE